MRGPPAGLGLSRAAPGSNADLNSKIANLQAEKKALAQKLSTPDYCVDYITKGCFGNCGKMHVEKDEVEKWKTAKKALAAKQKSERKAAAKRARSSG